LSWFESFGELVKQLDQEGIMSSVKSLQGLAVCLGTLLLAWSGQLCAQDYPTRPVRLIIGIAPGSSPDILGRLMAQWLSERLGQPFIIENRPGGGGNIAIEAVVRAPADGYTLLLVTIQSAVNASLYDKLNYNFVRDIAPVASISRQTLALEVTPSLSARTVPEFIAYAKSNPGRLSMASAGNGSAPHVAGELFKVMAGVNMAHVPYRGGAPALTDLIGGQVQVTFADIASSIEHVKAGKLRALAVTTTARSEALPDLPPIADYLPGYDASGWFGIAAPKNTPADLIERLNKEIKVGLADPKIKARYAELGATVFAGSPAAFRKFIQDETEKWGKVIKTVGIKPE
jgi:tripartite-type tricarboxylate transporter receptor subunit TctC